MNLGIKITVSTLSTLLGGLHSPNQKPCIYLEHLVSSGLCLCFCSLECVGAPFVCEVLVLRLVWLGIRIVRRALTSLALHLLCVGSFWRCLRVIVRGVKSWLSE